MLLRAPKDIPPTRSTSPKESIISNPSTSQTLHLRKPRLPTPSPPPHRQHLRQHRAAPRLPTRPLPPRPHQPLRRLLRLLPLGRSLLIHILRALRARFLRPEPPLQCTNRQAQTRAREH
jgi:uncharacterized membrane protein YccC